ncbi:MAG TPA: hypothetical protein VI365_33320, partial [Trebonia sp.]
RRCHRRLPAGGQRGRVVRGGHRGRRNRWLRRERLGAAEWARLPAEGPRLRASRNRGPAESPGLGTRRHWRKGLPAGARLPAGELPAGELPGGERLSRRERLTWGERLPREWLSRRERLTWGERLTREWLSRGSGRELPRREWWPWRNRSELPRRDWRRGRDRHDPRAVDAMRAAAGRTLV